MTPILCRCGCGLPAPVPAKNDRAIGHIKGVPRPFLPGHHRRGKATKRGYRMVGYKFEHVALAEKAIGRTLPIGAQVHHVDGNGTNNAGLNLVICQDQAYHRLLHTRAAVVRSGGDPNKERMCSGCKRPVDVYLFCIRKSGRDKGGYTSTCQTCVNRRRRKSNIDTHAYDCPKATGV